MGEKLRNCTNRLGEFLHILRIRMIDGEKMMERLNRVEVPPDGVRGGLKPHSGYSQAAR